jgi:hypothetical protein
VSHDQHVSWLSRDWPVPGGWSRYRHFLLLAWLRCHVPSAESQAGSVPSALLSSAQGEADVGNYKAYECLFPAMIRRWRERFANAKAAGPFPFGYVQLSS